MWLASDEDREGEAIAWHLCEVLGLDRQNTNRIVFHEITKPAILAAIENPRRLDMNLVNAQQARRVLDRLVGFKLSPVLWRKVKPSLSAGRVQSVAVRLIVEREREIQNFKSEPYYRITAVLLTTDDNGNTAEVKAEIPTRFKSHDEALAVLEMCRNAQFRVSNVTKRPLRRTPAPPFTTSTLQQEAARKLGFTVSQTMMVAQRLYCALRRGLQQGAPVPHQLEGCAGGSRGHPPHLHGQAPDRGQPAGTPPLRADMEAHRGFADGRCPDREDHCRD